jgi:two-component system, NarL family, sensor kinase
MQEKLSEVVLILVGSTLITLILATLIVIALFIAQKRKFRHRKELVDLKHNYDQEVLRTQLETQTQTFETISQELHDNVGNLISMAMVQMKAGVDGTSGKARNDSLQLLDEAMDILRDISRSINPENIQRRGLEQSIRNELDRMRRSRLYTAEYVREGVEFAMDPQLQIILFRIVQEALNNVIKHSGGKKITVSVCFNDPHISVAIQDNGRGFVFQDGTGDFLNHSGITNMRKRAALIGAELSITSELEKGTHVKVDYPALNPGEQEKYHKHGIPFEEKKEELHTE